MERQLRINDLENPADLKENRKIRYTKMVIRDSLIELMQGKPVLNISIKEICELADISRSTFYAHYKDQYDLLRQTEEETFSYLEGLLYKYEDKRSKRELNQLVEEVLTHIANNKYIQVLLSEHGNLDFQKKLFRHLTLRKQITGFFSEKLQDDESIVCYYVFVVNGIIGLIQHWVKNNMSIPVPKLARMIFKWTVQQIADALKL